MKSKTKLAAFWLSMAIWAMAQAQTAQVRLPAPGSAAATAPSGLYSEERPLVVGVLLFDGFEPLDAFGPIEIFGALGARAKIVTLGEKLEPAKPRFGPSVAVERTLDDPGPLDLLIVPGGQGTRTAVNNPQLLAAIKRVADSTPEVASVCTGSGLLARAGLLTGRKATSNKRAFQWAVSQDRSVQWIHEARWVEDGKYATSSGISAGMDLALGLVAKLFSHDTAVKIARNVEYVWNEDPTKDPFAALNAYTARNDPTKKYALRGVIVDLFAPRHVLLIRCEEIPGIVDATKMSFNVDEATLALAHKGDTITANLYQLDGEWRLENLQPVPPAR